MTISSLNDAPILGGVFYTENDLKSCGFGSLGTNVRIHSRASIYGVENIYIGSNVRIDDYTVIIATGKLYIGDYVSIPNFCFLGAKYGITLNNHVTFAPGVKIFSASDDYTGEFLTGNIVPAEMVGGMRAPVCIEDHVIIGAGSIILPGTHIQTGCAVGALSLVKRHLKAWTVYAGVPAKPIKPRKKEMLHFLNGGI